MSLAWLSRNNYSFKACDKQDAEIAKSLKSELCDYTKMLLWLFAIIKMCHLRVRRPTSDSSNISVKFPT